MLRYPYFQVESPEFQAERQPGASLRRTGTQLPPAREKPLQGPLYPPSCAANRVPPHPIQLARALVAIRHTPSPERSIYSLGLMRPPLLPFCPALPGHRFWTEATLCIALIPGLKLPLTERKVFFRRLETLPNSQVQLPYAAALRLRGRILTPICGSGLHFYSEGGAAYSRIADMIETVLQPTMAIAS